MAVLNRGYEQNKSLPSIVVKMEECQEEGGVGKWFGVASGDGQCSLCSGRDAIGDRSETHDCLQKSACDWDDLTLKQHGTLHHSSSECLAQVPSLLEPTTAENERVGGNRKASFHASSSKNVASSLSTTGDTSFHPGGSTLAVVPSQSGRSLDVPLGSSFSSTSSSCQSSATISSDSCSMSSDTSSFNSECQDDEEIALAMQAAEIANRNEARAKFRF